MANASSLPRSSLKPLSRKTGDSGESGKDDGQVVEDTRLPLLLSPFSLISQWSDIDELVEPVPETHMQTQKGHQRRII